MSVGPIEAKVLEVIDNNLGVIKHLERKDDQAAIDTIDRTIPILKKVREVLEMTKNIHKYPCDGECQDGQ